MPAGHRRECCGRLVTRFTGHRHPHGGSADRVQIIGLKKSKTFVKFNDSFQMLTNFVRMATGKTDDCPEQRRATIDYAEIVPVRKLFRGKKYLTEANSERDHASLDGQVRLSNELFNFTAEAEIIRDAYNRAFVDCDNNFKPDIVYITEDEKQTKASIESKTKVEIHREILLKLNTMEPDEASLMEDYFNKTVKRKNKDEHLTFYHVINE